MLSETIGLRAAQIDDDQLRDLPRVPPTANPRPPAALAVPLDDMLGKIRTVVQAEVSAAVGRLAAPPTTTSASLAPTTSAGKSVLT